MPTPSPGQGPVFGKGLQHQAEHIVDVFSAGCQVGVVIGIELMADANPLLLYGPLGVASAIADQGRRGLPDLRILQHMGMGVDDCQDILSYILLQFLLELAADVGEALLRGCKRLLEADHFGLQL